MGYGDLLMTPRAAAAGATAGEELASPDARASELTPAPPPVEREAPRRSPTVPIAAPIAPVPIAAPPPSMPAPIASAAAEVSPSRPPAERIAALAALATEAATCRACRLCEQRNSVVFGTGPHDARLMFIGEGPGEEEDRQGLPFVGRAGEKLNQMIRAMGFAREEVYITNIVKCRPPGNRDPQADEAAACRHFLDAQIDAIAPRVIVALGRPAANTLLGTDATLGKLRGRFWSVRGIDTMVTYHPAAILRNESWRAPTWEDLQQVMARLGKPLPKRARSEPERTEE